MDQLWTRSREALPTVVIADQPPKPPAPGQLLVLRIDCSGAPATLGPLELAQRQLQTLLGDVPTTDDKTTADDGPRRRLLGDRSLQAAEASFIATCRRLAGISDLPVALLFARLDEVDTATLTALSELVDRGNAIRVALILHFAQKPNDRAAVQLLKAVQACHGPEAVQVADTKTPKTPTVFDASSLRAPILQVVRAAAVIGSTFEAELLGHLLDLPTGKVLEALQEAADAGVPLADRGDGVFMIPAPFVDHLKSRMLPSLVGHWHRTVAERVTAHDKPEPATSAEVPRLDPSASQPEDDSPSDRQNASDAPPEPIEPPYPQIFEDGPRVEPDATGKATDASSQPAPVDLTGPNEPPATHRTEDHARAARHLDEAGEVLKAAEAYVEAIEQLTQRGDTRRALMVAKEALGRIGTLGSTPAGALVRAKVLAAAGRAQWQGAAGGASTLQVALETLEEAAATLPPNAPVPDASAVASTLAGICYDLGDIGSLQRALSELAESSRRLQASGDPVGAARLLNDQAAVLLRAGDPVQATHLLTRSREVFERLRRDRSTDPVVVEELAETEHLLARLPLQARVRPGREVDAYSLALGHARAALDKYRSLDRELALARVRVTMGQLEIKRNREKEAAEHLNAAAATQRRFGDVTGLAKTAAAMSDLYVSAGRPVNALALLGESIALNVRKGSPLGLAFNRRAFESLERALMPDGDRSPPITGSDALQAVRSRLLEGEEILGRIGLPHES